MDRLACANDYWNYNSLANGLQLEPHFKWSFISLLHFSIAGKGIPCLNARL
jgi:hypothetical protein